jgi:hypothetical protein
MAVERRRAEAGHELAVIVGNGDDRSFAALRQLRPDDLDRPLRVGAAEADVLFHWLLHFVPQRKDKPGVSGRA